MSSLAAIRPRALLRCADTCGSRFQGIGDDDAGVWRRSSWALTSGDGFGCTHAGGVVAAQSGFPVSETASHETRRTFLSSFGLAARVGVLQRLTRVGSSGAIRGKSSGQALNWGGLRLCSGAMRNHKTAYRDSFGRAAGKPWVGKCVAARNLRGVRLGSSSMDTRSFVLGFCCRSGTKPQKVHMEVESRGRGVGSLEEREFTYGVHGWPSLNPRCGQQLSRLAYLRKH